MKIKDFEQLSVGSKVTFIGPNKGIIGLVTAKKGDYVVVEAIDQYFYRNKQEHGARPTAPFAVIHYHDLVLKEES